MGFPAAGAARPSTTILSKSLALEKPSLACRAFVCETIPRQLPTGKDDLKYSVRASNSGMPSAAPAVVTLQPREAVSD